MGKVLDTHLKTISELSMPEFLLMLSLERNPGSNKVKLATALGMPSTEIDILLNSVIIKKYVNVIGNKENPDEPLVIITDLGRNKLNNAHKTVNEKYQEFFKNLSENERRQFDDMLDEIIGEVSTHL